MLTKPSYINALELSGTQPQFRADPVEIDQLFDNEVPVVDEWMADATERAKIAFSAATAEWIAWCLDGIVDITDILQFIEAQWAAVIDYRYAREIPHEEPEDDDAACYVLFVTWQTVNALFRLCQKEEGDSDDCARLSLVARHVLPKKHHGAFKQWLKFVLSKRIGKLWQVDEDESDPEVRQGPPVPRKTFNPDIDFEPNKTDELLKEFLENLNYNINPYLRSPDEMKNLGFSGEPYRI